MDINWTLLADIEKKGILLLSAFMILVALQLLQLIEWSPSCLIKSFLHIECWGCGTYRAAKLLFQGNIQASWSLNPLAIIISGYLIIRIPILAIRQIKRK